MARDFWFDCQDKVVGKKALIGLPSQCLILISSPPSMKGKSPLNTQRNSGGTRRNQVSISWATEICGHGWRSRWREFTNLDTANNTWRFKKKKKKPWF